jgi:hypothetical protein
MRMYNGLSEIDSEPPENSLVLYVDRPFSSLEVK